ncbi:reverse transcriptase domain-containing protein [Tanacetum coccineum]
MMSTREHKKRHRSRRSCSPRPSPSVFSRIRRERSRSPRKKSREKEGGVFKRLGNREKSVSTRSDSHNQCSYSRYTEAFLESEDSGGGHWKSRSNKKKPSREEDDLSQPWQLPKQNGEVAASNHEQTKSLPPWKHQEATQRQNFKKGGSRNQQRSKRKQDRFMFLTKTPKEIFALEKGKFKAPPPMTTPVEKRNHTKFCEFHGEVGHNTDEYEDEGTEGPMIIEAEIGGHFLYHMSPSPYNEIIGRPGVRKLQAVLSMAHGMPKILVEGGVITLKSSRLVLLECALVSGPEETPQAPKPMVEERVKVAINPEYLEQTVMISSTLTEEGHNKLCNLLQRNLDIFAWKPTHMTGVPRHIAEHRLNVLEGCSPVRQKKRGQAADRNQAIHEEVRKLVEAGIIKEVHYHDWLSNPVMLIAKLPMLTAPMEKEELIVYLVAAKEMILADFIVERPEEDSLAALMEVEEELLEPWILFAETNNEAEYEALIAELRIAEQMGVKNLQASVDSRLVANQVNETSENKKADALSKIASTSFAHLSKQVLVEELKEKSISEVEILAVVEEEGDTWMTPIFEYLKDETLPADYKQERAVRCKSQRFAVINKTLYIKSFLGPWLRCVGPLQANYVLRKIHEGACSMHAGTRFVMAKALRIGYYWPTMPKDAKELIRAFQDCQVHKPVPRNLQQKLTPIMSSWPFYKWRIDIARPFPEGPVKVKFLIVAMDYFIKWIEAKSVATITGNQIKKFVWDNIVCRFGLPGEIISDNGKQFKDNPFKDWCEKLCIRQHFASVKHPQTNGLVERANRSLGEGIKARLDARSKNWMEELHHVLWTHRTMIKSSNRDTPFSLTY